jgi:hypothetical protein
MRSVQFSLLSSLKTPLIVASHLAHSTGGGGDSHDWLLMALDLCFIALEGGESWESEPLPKEAPTSDAVVMLRRRAGACLIAVSKAMPSVLVRHLEKLAARVSEMVSRGGLREMQRMHCLEMLVAVSNAVEDPQERVTLVGQIVGDSVREWTGEEISTMVANPMALLTNCLGIDVAPFTQGADPRYVSAILHRVHGISNALNTLQSVSRRVTSTSLSKAQSSPNLSALDTSSSSSSSPSGQIPPFSLNGSGASSILRSHGSSNNLSGMLGSTSNLLPILGSTTRKLHVSPFAPLWPVILPNALSLIRSLHGIWAPDCTQHLFSFGGGGGGGGLSYLLTMSEQEMGFKANLSGITQPKLPGADGASSTIYEEGGDSKCMERERERWFYSHLVLYKSSHYSTHTHNAINNIMTHFYVIYTALGSVSLEEMRKRWLNELRTVVYVLIGTASSHVILSNYFFSFCSFCSFFLFFSVLFLFHFPPPSGYEFDDQSY